LERWNPFITSRSIPNPGKRDLKNIRVFADIFLVKNLIFNCPKTPIS